jgi:hypothetical protein
MLYLTADELAALGRELEALAGRYFERTTNPELRPDDARLVIFLQLAFPAAPDG